MACEAGEDAVQRVLGNPDLVALILEHLSTPWLRFASSDKLCARALRYVTRWAASQVNTIFRKAALRLPWEAEWGGRKHSSSSGLEALAFLRSRNITAWRVCLWDEPEPVNHNAAAIFNHAHSTVGLSIENNCEGELLKWLYDTLVPLPGEHEGWHKEMTVLSRLASLSRLTYLCVNYYVGCPEENSHVDGGWYDASWLSALSQLKGVELLRYKGLPLADLPALESLEVSSCGSTVAEGALYEWALPRLTALTHAWRPLHLGLPPSGYAAHCPCVSGREAGVWLSGLRRLKLRYCFDESTHNTGLRELVPGLTHLSLSWDTLYMWVRTEERKAWYALLFKGWPVGLRALELEGSDIVWSAVFELQDLVSLDVKQEDVFAYDDVSAVVAGLTGLPHLQHVHLDLRTSNRDEEARVAEGFRALGALLRNRKGYLHFEREPYWYEWY